eukprot:2713459-Pyramimonas_sp.AAC.1
MGPHEALYWAGETHAAAATGAFGGAPYGATERCAGQGRRMRPRPMVAFGGAPYGATKRVIGCAVMDMWRAKAR